MGSRAPTGNQLDKQLKTPKLSTLHLELLKLASPIHLRLLWAQPRPWDLCRSVLLASFRKQVFVVYKSALKRTALTEACYTFSPRSNWQLRPVRSKPKSIYQTRKSIPSGSQLNKTLAGDVVYESPDIDSNCYTCVATGPPALQLNTKNT